MTQCSFYKLISLMLLTLCVGCMPSSRVTENSFTMTGPTMGTTYTVKVCGDKLPAVNTLKTQIHQTLGDVNRRMSTYIEDSEISRFNAYDGTDWFNVSQETALVVAKALEVSRRTGGAFDPTVGPLVRLWSFGPGHHELEHRKINQKPSDAEIDVALAKIGYEKLAVRRDPPALRKTEPHVELDLSGIAKGYAVDQVAELLDRLGIKNYMVEVGGEVRTQGVNSEGHPWRIAIEKPDTGGRSIQQVIELRDGAMATSGDYRNYFEVDGIRYSHLLDPTTGRPIRHRLASVSVRRPTCMEADALATGMIVLGPEKAEKLAHKEGLDITLLVRSGIEAGASISGLGYVEKKVQPAKPREPAR